MMSQVVGQASEADLGGHKLAKQLAGRLRQAQKLLADPTNPKDMKKAGKQLKQFATKLGKGLVKNKVKPALGDALSPLVGEAQAELAGLVAG